MKFCWALRSRSPQMHWLLEPRPARQRAPAIDAGG